MSSGFFRVVLRPNTPLCWPQQRQVTLTIKAYPNLSGNVKLVQMRLKLKSVSPCSFIDESQGFSV